MIEFPFVDHIVRFRLDEMKDWSGFVGCTINLSDVVKRCLNCEGTAMHQGAGVG